MDLEAPDGRPATDRVHRSEEVFHGDASEGAPDLLPVLREGRFDLDDQLFEREPFTDVGDLPRGVHHLDGIGLVAGPGVVRGGKLEGSIGDVTPTLLYQADLEVPEGLDGAVLTDAFEARHLGDRPVRTTAALRASPRVESESPYSEEEESQIEESLRGLGYL